MQPAAPWCPPGKIFTLGTKRSLAAKKGGGAGSQPLERAATVTAREPAPSTPTSRRGSVPQAGEGGRGQGEDHQPEIPRTDFSSHVLHSRHPAAAAREQDLPLFPQYRQHPPLLAPSPSPGCPDQTWSPTGAPPGRHLRHPRDVTSSLAPPPTTASASFARGGLRGTPGEGTVAFPSPLGPPQRETRSNTHPTAAAPQGAARRDG